MTTVPKIPLKLKSNMTCRHYVEPRLNLSYYPYFLTPVETQNLIANLHEYHSLPIRQGRTTYLYGQKGLIYEVKFRNGTSRRPVQDWSQSEWLIGIRDKVSKLVGQDFNFCVVQYYPHGGVGINPHRDKEVTSGTSICGVSLGAARSLQMCPPTYIKANSIDIDLLSGSLYVMNPPSNDYWTHSILKNSSTEPRLSLTFRNIPDAKSVTEPKN